MSVARMLFPLLLILPALSLAAASDLSRDELKARQAAGTATVIVDVRSAEEFAEGHVAGAINIPHDQLLTRAGELAAHKADGSLVLYCRSGRRTALAVEALERQGFSGLNHLTGDMQGWVAAGEPVSR
jgi:phage shock protein E